MKVTINKSTKLDGKFVHAGEIEVTKKQKETLEKGGFLNDISKDTSAMTDTEVQKLVKKVSDLEEQVKNGGDNTALTTEIETLKVELEVAIKAPAKK